tara:strand:- start:503 stop:643 length:141 start_codon:yes stop_codon:yes gene_type:complete
MAFIRNILKYGLAAIDTFSLVDIIGSAETQAPRGYPYGNNKLEFLK